MSQNVDSSTPASAEPLSLKEIMLYNMTGIPLNLYDTVLMAWVMYFYIPPQNLGRIQYLSIATIGIILAGGRILDAVTDPLIGYLSDHSKSRWGRRKPFIFVSMPILLVSFVLVWSPPVEGVSAWNAVYLAGVLFFYYWSYTGVLIPWFAVLPEMSQENRERMKIATIGVAVSVIGVLVGGGLSGPLIEAMGPFKMALILGLFAFIAGEISLLGIKERYQPVETEKTVGLRDFIKILKQVFVDRQVLSFLVMIMLAQMTYQLMLMNVPYFTTLILGGKETDASMLMGLLVVIMAVATPFWYWMLSKFPKRNVFRFILLWMGVGYIGCFFIGRLPVFSPYSQAIILFALVMIPYGGMFATVLGIIADITDYDELKYGSRREAVYYGIYGIVRKTGWAFCSLLIAGIFSVFGYSVENPFGVKVVYLVCALVCFSAFLAFIPYKLGDSQSESAKIMNLQ
jgi:glycoside/pentoside/hexuronide:cation symporter, GPH family